MLQYGLESQNRHLRNAALFNLIVFLFNALISGLLLFLPQADLDYNIGYVRNLLSSLVLSPVSSRLQPYQASSTLRQQYQTPGLDTDSTMN